MSIRPRSLLVARQHRRDQARMAATALFASVTLGLPAAAVGADDEVRILIRSFIPNAHPTNPNYILPVPGHAGKFMIAGPGASKTGGKCYDTDHRSFSSQPKDSARLTSDFVLVASRAPTIRAAQGSAVHRADATIERDCPTGKESDSKTASIGACSIGNPAAADKKVQVVMSCSGGNPFFAAAPKIDYGGSFIYDTAAKTLSFKGNVGNFPAFEAYASLNGKPFVKLFSTPPKPGSSVWALFDAGLGVGTRGIEVQPTKLQ